MDFNSVKEYFINLQERIVEGLQHADGKNFLHDSWQRPEGGGGISCVMEEGNVLERGGVNFSHVSGDRLPPSASAGRPELAGRGFEAIGVSLVLHPRNPHAPTVHLNVRCFMAKKAGENPVWWFGGGMDLTPYYGFEEDAQHFHRTCREALVAVRRRPPPALQEMVRRVFFPQAPQRAARRRRHLLRRFQRARIRAKLRHDPQRRRPLSRGLPADPRSAASTRLTAIASAISRPIGAGATWNSTWCTTAAPCSACNPADAPSPS